jgi:hypothetical protein
MGRLKPNILWLSSDEKVICQLTVPNCPRSSTGSGSRYMGKLKCSGCPNAVYEQKNEAGYRVRREPYVKSLLTQKKKRKEVKQKT